MKILLLAILLITNFSNSFSNKINTNNSSVRFEISKFAFLTVEGKFTGMTGNVHFNENDLSNSNFNVCIDATTIFTDDEERDQHLKSNQFFDIEKFPKICFISEKISKENGEFIASGNLTMIGNTKKVNIIFQYSNNKFEGKLIIDRTTFGLGENAQKSAIIGNEVEIFINCQLKN